jgi:uncharacterized protein YceH (UPF0502 family)
MPQTLTVIEARIVGSLIEKSLTTPDQYPLTLNALTNACNQKTSRDPVMNVEESDVARALATLQQNGLVSRRNEPGSRVTKFQHHVENLIGGGSSKEVGAICVLLLRGPQTPGEIKTRTDRLCEFTDVADVEQVLQDLAARSDGPYVARLPRQPGQKEARYQHLFSGAPAEAKPAEIGAAPAAPAAAPHADGNRLARIEARLSALEARVGELLDRLKRLAG